MTSLKNIFGSICPEVESELKSNLRGFTGFVVRSYLPQNWIFKTEKETITFSVDKNGNASVKTGADSGPDVTIDIDYDYLSTALSTRSRPLFPPRKNSVKFHTPKGKTAFNFLRKRFGL